MQPHYTPTPKDLYRFWSKVDLSQGNDGCWIWTGAHSKEYGQLVWNRRVTYAHRIVWEIVYHQSPDEMMLCHHCDNPSCVNPQHLFLGTHADNMADRNTKNRQASGMRQGSAKLTDEQVAEIRQRYVPRLVSQRKLAREYGVSQMHIRRILNGFRATK